MDNINAFTDLLLGQSKDKPAPRKYDNLPDCPITGEIYPLPLAAVLWCGVPQQEAEAAVEEATDEGKGIYSHPFIPCLEKKTRALYYAIEKGELRTCREHGEGGENGDHVAYGRRHFWASDLKAFIEEYYPDDKPAFLFDETERTPSIDVVEYQRMNAEYTKQQAEFARLKIELESAQSLARDSEAARNAAEERLEKAKEVYRQQRAEIDRLKTEVNGLNNRILESQQAKEPNDRESLLNIMAALKDTLIDKRIYKNQAEIIDYLANESETYGLSEANLKAKFAEANKLKKSN